MRSWLLDRDFALLSRSFTLYEIVDDGFATDLDRIQGIFLQKKNLLKTRFQDFKDCMDFLDPVDRLIHQKRINRKWGTSEDLLKIVEDHFGHPISHGALLFALDLRGVWLEQINGRKDAYLSISSKSELC